MVLRLNINQIEPKNTRLDLQNSNCRNRTATKALTRNKQELNISKHLMQIKALPPPTKLNITTFDRIPHRTVDSICSK
ncbi:hypothetical protein H5410_023358 [Solanum commersonii]|uniref:Uncharacterized protein n=1 Tax=Solanum commersonii TaxID=4109 RepID=A0A9J5ZI13_SOLCO|nr:hypothetical protein H5410_023358 [Solanum commersonii]